MNWDLRPNDQGSRSSSESQAHQSTGAGPINLHVQRNTVHRQTDIGFTITGLADVDILEPFRSKSRGCRTIRTD